MFMKKIIAALFVLLCLAFLGVLYLEMKSSFPTPYTTQGSMMFPQNVAKVTAQDTSKNIIWETYHAKDLGFTIQFPHENYDPNNHCGAVPFLLINEGNKVFFRDAYRFKDDCTLQYAAFIPQEYEVLPFYVFRDVESAKTIDALVKKEFGPTCHATVGDTITEDLDEQGNMVKLPMKKVGIFLDVRSKNGKTPASLDDPAYNDCKMPIFGKVTAEYFPDKKAFIFKGGTQEFDIFDEKGTPLDEKVIGSLKLD